MSTAADIDATQALVERFTLKAFVESCLVLEEGVATIRDIDLAMMTGFGIIPPPFARADATGLDDVLAALERAAGRVGRALRAAADPAPAGRPGAGWARRPGRASSPTRAPTTASSRA